MDNDLIERLRKAIQPGDYLTSNVPNRLLLEAAAAIEAARATNRRLHRRTQIAEAAVPDYAKLIALPPDGDGVRFVNGSFGRILLAGYCDRLSRELEAARADAGRLDWLDSQRGDDVQCDRNGDPELVAHYWSVYDQCYGVREAIDAAMAAEGRE